MQHRRRIGSEANLYERAKIVRKSLTDANCGKLFGKFYTNSIGVVGSATTNLMRSISIVEVAGRLLDFEKGIRSIL